MNMHDQSIVKICDDDEIDIQNIVDIRDFEMQTHSLSFGIPVASAFRFRYQSEIDKKSCSSIKGEKDKIASIKVFSSIDATLQLDLITENSSSENAWFHFNTLYEVTKSSKYAPNLSNGICNISIKKDSDIEIKLDFLGIKKFKSKEAIPRIQEIYPSFSETESKQFFNDNKESVKLRAVLYEGEKVLSIIYSDTIRAQNAKEYKHVKIQHISPKIVAGNGETLIIILAKKITCKCTTYLIFDDGIKNVLYSKYSDGQTFAFALQSCDSISSINATIRMESSDSHDEIPIKFMQTANDARKRKPSEFENNSPLKKPTNYDSPQPLYPESSGCSGSSGNIQYDGPQLMETQESNVQEDLTLYADQLRSNESCKDSGIHSDDRLSNTSDMESDSDDSFHESDDESEDINDINENHVRRSGKIKDLEPINFPQNVRYTDNRLVVNREDQVAKKIFSEVSRIGHDFAFGKEACDLFYRIEKHLPVVFTLQDDVGDTPLNNAILKGNVMQAERILQVLINQCKWALDLVNTSGHTALILSPACEVPPSFITKLLDAGCRLDIWDDLDKSAISYAIEYKNTVALVVLLDYIEKKNMRHMLARLEKVHYSPLQIAVMNDYAEGVKMLLSLKDINDEYMVDVNELALMNEETALHLSVERGSGMDVIGMLLSRPDININHRKDNKATVLTTAMKMNMTELVVLLKQHGAKDFESEEAKDCLDVMDDDCSAHPVAEMTPGNGTSATVSIETLTARVGAISLKKEKKTRLINVLLNGDICLNASELEAIFKPAFKTLLAKYNSDQQQGFIDMVNRFNCLPNSMDELFVKLQHLNRVDMINKIVRHFAVGLLSPHT